MSLLRGNRVIGILREGKSKWERRVPLSPRHVQRLVANGLRVLVQPSTRRVFGDSEYVKVGAEIQEDLSPASFIVGVKEVPIANLLPERTYAFFSHTIKAQPYNMPLLDAMLEKRIRLVDYECITETGGRTSSRLVAFGRFAGIAGMINLQRGLGERLLAMGYSTPFLGVGSSYMYPDLDAAKAAVARCGEMIAANGTPEQLGPLTFAFLGDGKVSRGAQEIFKLLPHEMVSPDDFAEVIRSGDRTKLYGALCTAEHLVRPACGGPMTADLKPDYYMNPENYVPAFHENIAQHCSVLVNSVFWTERYPRILETQQQEELQRTGRSRLLAVGDISCDLAGSIQFLTKFTTSEEPYYLYDVEAGVTHDSLDDHGILMLAHDTLPSELPREASEAFGDALLPFIPAIASSNGEAPFDRQTDIPEQIRGAVICDKGQLTPSWAFITDLRAQNERLQKVGGNVSLSSSSSRLLVRGHLFDNAVINKILDLLEHTPGVSIRIADWQVGASRDEPTSLVVDIFGEDEDIAGAIGKINKLADALSPLSPIVVRQISQKSVKKAQASAAMAVPVGDELPAVPPCKVLVLGSGLVCGPVVDYLNQQPMVELTIASAELSQAQALASGKDRVAVTELDVVNDEGKLASLIGHHDLVISLVPASLHIHVAKICVQTTTHMVTASYLTPEMRAMSRDAEQAGIVIINEVGLDPGLDHMSAMSIINEVKSRGGVIDSFVSLCGGLPAPEATDNPLGYKFSWSPRGVLSAGLNPAKYLMAGAEINVPGTSLFDSARRLSINGPALALEMLPNRNSLLYREAYGLEAASTIFRGTLRYAGFSEMMSSFSLLGLFAETKVDVTRTPTWGALIASLLPPIPAWESGDGAVRAALRRRFVALQGEAGAARILPAYDHLRLFDESDTGALTSRPVIDQLCDRMQQTCSYSVGERDMCLMHHKFEVTWPESDAAPGGRESITSSLLAYGAPYPSGPSSMALTVGLPTAVAARLVLDGTIRSRGVMIPTRSELYEPILREAARHGITFVERASGRMADVFSKKTQR